MEKQQTPKSVFGLDRLGSEPTVYRIRGEPANHYANDAVIFDNGETFKADGNIDLSILKEQ